MPLGQITMSLSAQIPVAVVSDVSVDLRHVALVDGDRAVERLAQERHELVGAA